MITNEKYFAISEQLKDIFLSLKDRESGLLLTALSDYHFHGKEPRNLSAYLMGMYNVLKIVSRKDFKL